MTEDDRRRDFERGFNPGGHGGVCGPVIQTYKARPGGAGPSIYAWNAQRSPRGDNLYKIKYSKNGQCHSANGPAIVVWDKSFIRMEYWYLGKRYAQLEMDLTTGGIKESCEYKDVKMGRACVLDAMGKDNLFKNAQGETFRDAVSHARDIWEAWIIEQLPDPEIALVNDLRREENKKIRNMGYSDTVSDDSLDDSCIGDVPLPEDDVVFFEEPPRIRSTRTKGPGKQGFII